MRRQRWPLGRELSSKALLLLHAVQVAIHHKGSAGGAVGLGLAFAWIGRLVGFPRASLAWVVGALIVRFWLGLHPAFPAADVFFHAHKLSAYEAGTLITSHVGGFGEKGVLPIPYPPLLYVVLSPFLSSAASAETLLRLAAALLESTAPFVVFGLMRAAGIVLLANG